MMNDEFLVDLVLNHLLKVKTQFKFITYLSMKNEK